MATTPCTHRKNQNRTREEFKYANPQNNKRIKSTEGKKITRSDHTNLFTQLGLTTRQAQVYFALAQSDQATAKTIARTLQVDRAEVYRAITELEKIGITQRILTTPTAYKATPITETFTILLEKNAEKYNQIRAESKQFIQKFKENNQENTNQEEHKYSLSLQPEDSLNSFIKVVKDSQTSINVIAKGTLLFKSRIFEQSEVFKEAIERGVKFRYIIHLLQGEKIPMVVHSYDKNAFSIRETSTSPQTTLIIVDKKEIHLINVEKADREKPTRQVLHSNNPKVAATCQDYFELKWLSAHKIEHKNKPKPKRKLVPTP